MDLADDGLPAIRDVLARIDHRARRALGQHFIRDLNYTRFIAESSGPLDGFSVLEVGPGPGGLTRALLQCGAARVVVIERDSRFRPALDEIAARWPGRLEIIEGDAMQVEALSRLAGPARIIANLPYNIAGPLLAGWLGVPDWPPGWHCATLMLQKEMADRLTAEPGTRAYGRLSVLAQWRTELRILARVPRAVFLPRPNVDSCLLELRPRTEPAAGFSPGTLMRLTGTAFQGRRKMLRRSLAMLAANPETLLRQAGIDPTLRADALSVDGFCALARGLETGC